MKRADVALETGQARVVYDDRQQTAEKLAAAIDILAFKASIVSVSRLDPPGRNPPSGGTR